MKTSEPEDLRNPFIMSEPIKGRNPEEMSEPENLRNPFSMSEENRREMKIKRWIWIALVLIIGLLYFISIPKPLVIGQVDNANFIDSQNFIRREVTTQYMSLGENKCMEYSALFLEKAEEVGLSFSLVIGWHDGNLHAWVAFKSKDKFYYVEPQETFYGVWTISSSQMKSYRPWLIVGKR